MAGLLAGRGRRLLTVPICLLLAVLFTASAPLWIPAMLLVSLLQPCRGALRMMLFIMTYLWCESVGILVSLWLWLRYLAPQAAQSAGRDTAQARKWLAFLASNSALQDWWANSLKRAAGRIFDLQFFVDGEDALAGAAAIVLPRHTSIGDTVVPIVWYGIPQRLSFRYVLKKELQFDPSLDIVGNRLPNYFVDRFSDDPAAEVAGVARLLADITANEGVVIYPEGTRFTPAKRQLILARYRERGDTTALARAERWPNLLPPRTGGTLALLTSNPGRDLLFIAHTGFEGSARFSDLINGAWAHSKVRLRFWRVPFAQVPTDADALRAFLFQQWDRMSKEVAALQAMNTSA